METFPLQLVISTAQGNIHAPLREDTEIRTPVGTAGNLRMLWPGVRVSIENNILVLE